MSRLGSGQNPELSWVVLMELRASEQGLCTTSLGRRMEPELTAGSVLACDNDPARLAQAEEVTKQKFHTIISMNFQLTEAVNPDTIFRHHQPQRPNSDNGVLPLSPCFSSSCLTHCLLFHCRGQDATNLQALPNRSPKKRKTTFLTAQMLRLRKILIDTV